MPTYEYEAASPAPACEFCRAGFELVRGLREPPVTACPRCGAPVRKIISAPAIGRSASSLDARAKTAGFTKLKRLGKGEYEKQY
ncbi:MAG: zinc ribbon domain-containing protein [bacterium]